MVKFFVYGIFVDHAIRKQVFNREIDVKPAILRGWKLGYHKYGFRAIHEDPDSQVNGFIMELEDHEIPIIDKCEHVTEPNWYKRKTVIIEGENIEVYYEEL